MRKSAGEIIDNLVSSFHKILQESVWMDYPTKAEALKKLEAMGRLVGYMDSLLIDSNLKEAYKLVSLFLTKEQAFR